MLSVNAHHSYDQITYNAVTTLVMLLLTHKQAQNPNFNLKKVLKVGYEMYQMYNKNNATPMQLGEYAAKSLGFDIKKDGLKTLKGLF
jgi:hypothetical protein